MTQPDLIAVVAAALLLTGLLCAYLARRRRRHGVRKQPPKLNADMKKMLRGSGARTPRWQSQPSYGGPTGGLNGGLNAVGLLAGI